MSAGIVVILAFFGLFVVGVPVAFAILIPSVIYVIVEGIPLATVAQRSLYALDSFPLVAVPVFIFVGNLMNNAGITEKLFHFANVLVGRMYGGLAQVNIFASLIFSGVSGAALADVGGLGRIEIKAMREQGFPLPFATAVTGASAIVGPIFPPSIPIIIYASVASVSTIQLLIAGIVPALVCVLMLMLMTALIALRRDLPRAQRWPTLGEVGRAFLPAAPALLAPVLLIGGMLSGRFTPTEASAVAAVYVLVVGVFLYRAMPLRFVRQAAVDTVKATVAILFIVAAAAMFGWILAVEQVPQMVRAWFSGLPQDVILLLIIVNLIFFVAGMFIDYTTATLLLVPIIAPPVVAAGVDPIQLGILVIFNLMIGTVTPPFGLSLFLLSNMTGVPFTRIIRAMLPFYLPLGLTLACLTLFPQLSTGLPALLR